MTTALAEPGTTAQKLLNAVSVTAARQGVAGLSSRSVADAAGVSASAVNYTFGCLDKLLELASGEADARAVDFWLQEQSDLATLQLHAGDLGPALFVATRRMVERLPGEQALFWADIVKAARVCAPTSMHAGLEAERRYWSELLDRSGLEHVDPALVQAFSLALRFAYQVFAAPGRFDPWALALVQRFSSRLSGRAHLAAGESAYRERAERLANLSEVTSVPRHQTARQILDAAVQTILERGAEAATFREIARRAGLSVSSVQHFFGSRRTYLIAAFQSIYAAARDRAITDVPPAGSLTARELSHHLASESPDTAMFSARDFAAMQGLMLSAAYDPDTRVLAEGLLARTGQTSFQLLQALTRPRGQICRLDAQILSMVMTHLVTLQIAGQIPQPPANGLKGLARHLLESLFE